MIGSLDQFIQVNKNSFNGFIFEKKEEEENENGEQQAVVKTPVKRRGHSTFQNYIPDDKSQLLRKFDKKNIFLTNKQKYHSIVKDTRGLIPGRKPLVERKELFPKSEIARDYIAKQQLKRKHNLLRAILRMKQTEDQPNVASDYEQSFQRLYSGMSNIHPRPLLSSSFIQTHTESPANIGSFTQKKLQTINNLNLNNNNNNNRSNISKRKRIEYEHIISWAKKHDKDHSFFSNQLGKVSNDKLSRERSLKSRSLIQQIQKNFKPVD